MDYNQEIVVSTLCGLRRGKRDWVVRTAAAYPGRVCCVASCTSAGYLVVGASGEVEGVLTESTCCLGCVTKLVAGLTSGWAGSTHVVDRLGGIA